MDVRFHSAAPFRLLNLAPRSDRDRKRATIIPSSQTVNNHFIELNEANFDQEVLNATQPVLVQFWAAWSDSCKAMAPILASVAEDAPISVKVARVNVEHHENLTNQCGVRAVPTLLIFNEGGVQDQIVGRTTEQAVRESLSRLCDEY